MKLNPDCIRDILIFVETYSNNNILLPINEEICSEDKKLRKYDFGTIEYHLRQCDLSGYFYNYRKYIANKSYAVMDLSPAGHDFLKDIRSDTIWSKVKSKAAEIGVESLSSLAKIAAEIVQAQITSFLTGGGV